VPSPSENGEKKGSRWKRWRKRKGQRKESRLLTSSSCKMKRRRKGASSTGGRGKEEKEFPTLVHYRSGTVRGKRKGRKGPYQSQERRGEEGRTSRDSFFFLPPAGEKRREEGAALSRRAKLRKIESQKKKGGGASTSHYSQFSPFTYSIVAKREGRKRKKK